MIFDSITELTNYGADWAVDFNGKLALELGPGMGHFSVALAKRYPRNFHILVDMNENSVAKIGRLISKSNLQNVGLIMGHAHTILADIEDDIGFQYIFSHFASPQNQKEKSTPRLYHTPTCKQIIRLCEPEGSFFATSDRDEVVEEFWKNLKSGFYRTKWSLPIPPLEEGTIVGTDMEMKFSKEFGNWTRKLHLRKK